MVGRDGLLVVLDLVLVELTDLRLDRDPLVGIVRQLELLLVDLEQLLELALAEVEPLERVERLLVALVDLEDLAVHVERAIDVALLLLDDARHHEHERQRIFACGRTSAATRRTRRRAAFQPCVSAASRSICGADLLASRGPRRAP